jgi:peptide/nickel transport system substrate-binding protein
MKKLALLALVVLVMGALVLPSLAQEGECCQGGIIQDSTFGSSNAATLNPIMSNDTASNRVISFLFPGLLGVDPETIQLAPNIPGALASGWEASEDGLVYTISLRDDMVWSDGTPMTSADVIYAWEALQDPEVQSPIAAFFPTVESVEAPDAQTVVVTFNEFDCTALATISGIPVLPSHALPANYDDLPASGFDLAPSVTGGPMIFGAYSPEQVSLVANPLWTDNELGYTNATGYIYRLVGTQQIQVEQFLAGDLSVIDSPAVSLRADIRTAEAAGDVQIYDWAGASWDYLALNWADSSNPQPALDEAGERIDQGHHPLFGDVRVRRAVSLGIDVNVMIERAVFGEGVRMASWILPGRPYTNEDLVPVDQDQEAAAALLEEAGFVDSDGDGVREATEDALYAEPGTLLEFTLQTNAGNLRRETTAQIVQEQLAEVGFRVNFEAIDFNVLVENLRGQTFDGVILGWLNGILDDPDATTLWTSLGDVPLSGQNYSSYYNERVDTLMQEGLTLPGCAFEERKVIYDEIQAILQEEVAYVFLFNQSGFYAAGSSVQGFDPRPGLMYWNSDVWAVANP